jgi:UDP-glucose 4-epimerase
MVTVARGAERQRAIVTGGAGFIGSHVANELVARDFEVLVVDDLSTGSEGNLPGLVVFELLDIVDKTRLADVFRRFQPNVVCHLAAQSSVTVSVREPERDLAVNVHGTFNICDAAKNNGATVVFASTGGALYGDAAPVPTPENFPPEPVAPYGASKLAGEAYVATWGRFHDLPNTILRLGNVYGPRQSPHGEAGVVAIFSDRLMNGESPTVYGDGRQTRDYIHVADVARAFAETATARRRGTFNVGTGVEHSVLDLLDHLQHAAGTSIAPSFLPLRAGELHRSCLDSTSIRATIGWQSTIAFDTGLRETYDWYSAAAETPQPG